MAKFLLWLILFVLCWPLALGALVAFPFVWLLLLPFKLVGIAVGGDVRSASLSIDFDGLTRLGKVPGLNASQPTSGVRDSYDFFAEIDVPLVPMVSIPPTGRPLSTASVIDPPCKFVISRVCGMIQIRNQSRFASATVRLMPSTATDPL